MGTPPDQPAGPDDRHLRPDPPTAPLHRSTAGFAGNAWPIRRHATRFAGIAWPTPSIRPFGRISLAGLAVASLYAVSVVLLFASRLREFADETDNLLGGLLLLRGARLYSDYFSSHMPLAYYVASIPAALGATRLEDFRPYTNALLVASTLLLVWGFRRTVPVPLLGLAATLVVFTHTVQFAEMLTAGSLAAIGIGTAALLAYTTPRLAFGVQKALALSLAVFVAVQSELLSIFPLAVIGVCYLAQRLVAIRRTGAGAQARQVAGLAGLIALPHALVLLAFWRAGSLGDVVYDAYEFNQRYYAQFLMNSSPLGILHDWEAQYRTYLLQSLSQPLEIQGLLVLANLAAAVLVGRSRGVLVGLAYYAFVALCHVRTEQPYVLASCFSLALVSLWAIRALGAGRWQASLRGGRGLSPLGAGRWSTALSAGRWSTALAVAALLLVGTFVIRVAGTYDLSGRPARVPDELVLIQLLTSPGDRIWVAPYDPYQYLESGRMPASIYPFYFPWQAIDPRSESRILQDLADHPPALVVFRGDEIVNGHWAPAEYGRRVLDQLEQRYAPLDPSAPILRNVLVPRDRLATARAQLAAAGLGG